MQTPPDHLSWGERSRALLATLSVRETGLLILDEPTNHLDLAAVEQVEAAIDEYQGAVLLVTHDERLRRSFVATRSWSMSAGELRKLDI
jgi:ATPase subunit of ABC transporter with duplicated ATPase domains